MRRGCDSGYLTGDLCNYKKSLDNAYCKKDVSILKQRVKGLPIRTKQRVFAMLLITALSVNLSSALPLLAGSEGAVLLTQHCDLQNS